MCVCVLCVRVCERVCVRDRERERERESKSERHNVWRVFVYIYVCMFRVHPYERIDQIICTGIPDFVRPSSEQDGRV